MPVIVSPSNITPNPISAGSPSPNHGLVAALLNSATPSARLWLCGAVLLISAAFLSCLSLLRRQLWSREEGPVSKSASKSQTPYSYQQLAQSGTMGETLREKPRAGSPADGVLGSTDKKESTAKTPSQNPSSTATSMGKMQTQMPSPNISKEEDAAVAGVGSTTGSGTGPETPPRRRSYTKVVDGVGVEVQEEIVVAEGWKRHTRVYGGGVCLACLESERNRRRMA